MPWSKLATRFKDLPLLIAGPILRQVTPNAVTVWVALLRRCTVTLTIYDSDRVPRTTLMQATRDTTAIGKNLHIVAVTARSTAALSEGKVYFYDLSFLDMGIAITPLDQAILKPSESDPEHPFPTVGEERTVAHRLAYAPWKLPSFAIPPSDLHFLRLIQGSCRMPHANGKDHLPLVNDLIAQTASNAFARPHQLLLTGDQIYADDVSDGLLLLLTDAGDTLLEWKPPEKLPGLGLMAAQLPPFWRERPLADAGFTSVDLRSHLLSLGEYMSMYLFVWSEVLWPPSLPNFIEIFAEVISPNAGGPLQANRQEAHDKASAREKPITEDNVSVEDFRGGLANVRRVLANVPTYMIFDDHEVTDDWNMTRAFCRKVYASELGLRVAQNALVAYSLCQHWGNVPEDFVMPAPNAPAGSLRPGASLLKLIDATQPMEQKAADYDRSSKDLRKLLAIHDATAVGGRDDSAVYHDSGSLRYDFSVEGPSHQVIFVDTRTWRSFPNIRGSHLLTRNRQTDQFKQQILDAPDTRDRLLFVVLTTNAPPAQPIRAATRHDFIANNLKHVPDLYEAWELPSTAFDRLLVALTSKLPLVTPQRHEGAVILLSGDVHFSFASRIIYRATKRYDDDVQPRAATAVVAQLVASSLKKQTEDTVLFHRVGYYAAPKAWITQRMIRHTLTEGYVGWNFPVGPAQKVADVPLGLDDTGDYTIIKGTLDVTPTDPLSGYPDSRKIDLTQAPHYRYRFDYLSPIAQFIEIAPSPIGPLPAGSSLDKRKEVARAHARAAETLRKYNRKNPPRVVGVNNFGEIKLDWGAADKRKVNFLVRWWDVEESKLKSTTYSVRLDINSPTDKEFHDIKARVEP